MPRLRPAPDEDKPITTPPAVETETPAVEVAAAPEVEVEVAPPSDNDATAALRKQIEDLRKSEQLHKEMAQQAIASREEALQRARDREAHANRLQKQVLDSDVESLSSLVYAAQAEIDKAQLDIENAITLGDAKGQAEALKRLNIASSNLVHHQREKDQAEAKAKAPPPAAPQDEIDSWGLPQITTEWLKQRRDKLRDPKIVRKMQYFQDRAEEEGLVPHTRPFLDWMEVQLGEREAPSVATETPRSNGPAVSAPVSRSVPNSQGKRDTGGKIKLTPAQVEAARISGVSVEEYAKQMLLKEKMVASGEYGEQR